MSAATLGFTNPLDVQRAVLRPMDPNNCYVGNHAANSHHPTPSCCITPSAAAVRIRRNNPYSPVGIMLPPTNTAAVSDALAYCSYPPFFYPFCSAPHWALPFAANYLDLSHYCAADVASSEVSPHDASTPSVYAPSEHPSEPRSFQSVTTVHRTPTLRRAVPAVKALTPETAAPSPPPTPAPVKESPLVSAFRHQPAVSRPPSSAVAIGRTAKRKTTALAFPWIDNLADGLDDAHDDDLDCQAVALVEVSFVFHSDWYCYSAWHVRRLQVGDAVLVEADRGRDVGTVKAVDFDPPVVALELSEGRAVLRLAKKHEVARAKVMLEKGTESLESIATIIKANSPIRGITFLGCEFRMDGSKLTIYYSAPARLPFSDSVRILHAKFGCRVQMNQLNYHEVCRLKE